MNRTGQIASPQIYLKIGLEDALTYSNQYNYSKTDQSIIMPQLKIRVLLLILLLTLISPACWTELPLIRTGTFQPITALTSPTANATTFSLAYTSLLNSSTGITWGLGLAGYNTYLTKTFSFRATVTIINDTSLLLNVQPSDDTYFLSLRMTYIVTGLNPTTNPPLELLNGCFKCLSISQPYNSTQNFTSRSQNFWQASTLSYNSTIQIRSFLYSFNYTNYQGAVNYLSISSSLNANGSYTHTVNTNEYNMIDYVCLSAIAWSTTFNNYGKGIAAFFQTYTLNIVDKTNLIPYYSGFDCDILVFMGISSLSHKMGGERLMSTHPEMYSQLSALFDYNSYFVSTNLNIFYIGYLSCNASSSEIYVQTNLNCAGSCLINFYANVSNVCIPCNSTCLTCSYSDPDICVTCAAGTNRTGANCTCTGLYFSNGSANCLLCSDYLSYCSSCSSSTVCTSCVAGKFLVNSTCRCLNITSMTYYVSGVCLTYPGCVSATNVLNANYCSSCNTTANFQHPSASNLTCVCVSGYNNSINPLVCTPICGDGTVNLENCDDRNTNNGDGCSVNCTVQAGYYCYVINGTTGPSYCVQVSTATIKYLYAERVPGSNVAKLYFLFSPTGTTLSSSGLQGGVSTNAGTSAITTTYSASTSKITVQLTFTQDMQGKTHNFTFDFSQAHTYYSAPITVEASTNGINEPLILQSYGVFVKTFQYVFIGMAALGIIIGAVCAIAGYKLMGLELLLPLQASFFGQFAMSNPPPYVSSLKYLKFSNGFNQLFTYDYEQFYQGTSKFPKFDYEVQMALNLNVMSALLLLSTLILLVLQLIYLYHHSKATSEQLQKAPPVQQTKKNSKGKKQEKVEFQVKQEGDNGMMMRNARLNRNVFVNNFFFYLAVAVSQQCFFAFIAQNMQVNVKGTKVSQDVNLAIGYVTLLLVVGNLIFLAGQLSEKKDKRIITFQETRVIKYPAFLICSYILFTLLISLTQTFSFAAYLTVALAFIPFIGFFYFRPYRHDETFINPFSAFLNLAFPIICSFVYLINNMFTLSQFGWVISSIIVLVSMIAVEITIVIRMVRVIPWRSLPLIEKCTKKGKKDQNSLLDKNKGDVQMSNIVKNSIRGQELSKIVDWQQKNKKEFESVHSKANHENEQQVQGSSDNQQQDELAQLKKRLKKEIKMKRAI